MPTLVWHHERAVGCEAGLTNHIRDCDTGLRHIRPIGASTSALCLRWKQIAERRFGTHLDERADSVGLAALLMSTGGRPIVL